MTIGLAILLSYLLGSISFGYFAGRLLRGIDIRSYGSGNTGTTNILRTLGTWPAISVLILDAGKGLSAVYLAHYLTTGTPIVAFLCGVAVVVGHNWPLFFGFRGGRGVATSIGVMLGLAPKLIIIAIIVGIVIIALTRYVSLGSTLGSLTVPIMMIYQGFPWPYILFSTVLALFIFIRHIPNIKRILKGTENKLGDKNCKIERVEK